MIAPVAESHDAAAHLRRLIGLTEALTERLEGETRAFAAHRPQDILGDLARTQELANQYRRESTLLKGRPDLASGAPVSDRMALIRATERFEAVLSRHAVAATAARTVSEGVIQAIAHEVTAARATGAGYGAAGQAAAADGTAITLNRNA